MVITAICHYPEVLKKTGNQPNCWFFNPCECSSTVQTHVIPARPSHSFSYGRPGVGALDQGLWLNGTLSGIADGLPRLWRYPRPSRISAHWHTNSNSRPSRIPVLEYCPHERFALLVAKLSKTQVVEKNFPVPLRGVEIRVRSLRAIHIATPPWDRLARLFAPANSRPTAPPPSTMR